MSGLSPEQHVTSVFIATLFFGIYLATLFSCLRWLLIADEGLTFRKDVQWVFVVVTLLLFCFSGANLALTLRSLRMEVQQPPPPPPTSSSTPAPNWVSIFDCTTSNLSALLADSVLIYRCWLVYEKSFGIIIFPTLVWLGGLATTILQLYWQIIQKKGLLTAWQPIDAQIGPGSILTAFWACTIALNGYATFVIARRLWSRSGPNDTVTLNPGLSLRFVGRVITESGLLYLVITVVHLIAWFTPSAYLISVASNINLPIIGISYNLIIIRTYHGRADKDFAYRNHPLVSSVNFVPHPKSMTTSHESMTSSFETAVTLTRRPNPDDDRIPIYEVSSRN